MENKKNNFCPKCGNKLTGNEKFCNVCGNPLQNDEVGRNTESKLKTVEEKQKVKKKSPGIIKKILIGVGGLLLIFWVIGLVTDSKETEKAPETKEVESISESKDEPETVEVAESEATEKSRSNIDVVSTLNNIGLNVDPKYELTDRQTEYIQNHLELFPAAYGNLEELSNAIDITLDYSHMIKNPKDLVGRFALINELAVRQIWEESYENGEGDFDYLTSINMYDENGNNYYVYYIGRPTNLVEDDIARVIAMPVAYSSYKSLDGTEVLTLVMVASVVEDSNLSEMTMGYFADQTDAGNEQSSVSETETEEYGYDAVDYAGRYEGGVYTITFSAGTDVYTDNVGDVCVYYNGNLEGEHLPVYVCTSAGDWDISRYDACYEVRDDGMYMMFYKKDGTIYMDYNSPYRNADVLELKERYES